MALADESHVDRATEVADTVGAKKMRELPAYVRQQILQNVVNEATRRRDEFGYYLAIEAGKPIKDARGEADRLIQTFQLAAEESTRIYGEYADLAIAARGKGYSSVTKRVPVGPVSLVCFHLDRCFLLPNPGPQRAVVLALFRLRPSTFLSTWLRTRSPRQLPQVGQIGLFCLNDEFTMTQYFFR